MSRPATSSIRTNPLLRAVLDHTASMVIVHDLAGRIVEANRYACDLLGYTRDELLALSVRDIEEEHRMTLGDHWERLTPGQVEVLQGTHRHADGSTFPVEVHLSAFEFEEQKLVCATCRPAVEARELAEESPHYRRLDRQIFQRIFEKATEAIAIIDHEGRYLRQNRAHLNLLGYEDAELAGKTPAIHLGPAAFEQVAGVLAKQGRYLGVHTSHTKAGEDLRLELSAFEVRLGPNQAPVFVGIKRPLVGRDLDHQTRADDDRRQLEEELRQAGKMEVLGRLAAGVAHDFNNLLTPILGYADSELSALAEDHPVAGSLRQIRQAAVRGRELTQQLLTFGRKRVLHLEMIDLGETVRRVANMLRRVIPGEVAIEVKIDPQTATIDGDEVAMEQILMNLATNARDAIGGQGSMTFSLSNVTLDRDDPQARTLGSGGDYVRLSVTDTGHGIEPQVRDRMFEPFFTDKPVGAGTGLGLSIVHGVVRQHEGVIHTESRAGGGTSVHILFHPSGTLPEQEPEVQVSGPAKATILVTEDDPQVRSLLRRMLGVLGHPCLVAGNAEQALAVAENHDGPIELLLTDVVMPNMGGDQLYRELRARRPGLKVLFVSGYPRDGLSISTALDDEVALMEKPFSLDQLRERLELILGSG